MTDTLTDIIADGAAERDEEVRATGELAREVGPPPLMTSAVLMPLLRQRAKAISASLLTRQTDAVVRQVKREVAAVKAGAKAGARVSREDVERAAERRKKPPDSEP